MKSGYSWALVGALPPTELMPPPLPGPQADFKRAFCHLRCGPITQPYVYTSRTRLYELEGPMVFKDNQRMREFVSSTFIARLTFQLRLHHTQESLGRRHAPADSGTRRSAGGDRRGEGRPAACSIQAAPARSVCWVYYFIVGYVLFFKCGAQTMTAGFLILSFVIWQDKTTLANNKTENLLQA